MSIDALTDKQRKVYDQLVLGRTNAAIARAVYLSEKTVKAYVTVIFKQLGCTTRSEVIARHYRGAR